MKILLLLLLPLFCFSQTVKLDDRLTIDENMVKMSINYIDTDNNLFRIDRTSTMPIQRGLPSLRMINAREFINPGQPLVIPSQRVINPQRRNNQISKSNYNMIIGKKKFNLSEYVQNIDN